TPEPTETPTPEPPTPTATPEPPPAIEPVGALGDIRGIAVLDPGGPDYVDFVDVTDDQGLITMNVPAQWSDVDGRQWDPEGNQVFVGPALTAAPDITAWRDTWGTPGVFIGSSDQLEDGSPAELLDRNQFSDSCDFDARRPYDDGVYTGEFDLWVNCGAEQSAFVVVAAQPADASFLVLVELLAASETDWDAIAHVVNTFLISPA
ncbi:MAG: hypothetical protein OEU32_15075, partial [Acidimicrobiia bacterium]|nr:hypothetical protein [Acidimicrobiia bacterium]